MHETYRRGDRVYYLVFVLNTTFIYVYYSQNDGLKLRMSFTAYFIAFVYFPIIGALAVNLNVKPQCRVCV